ncbi:MAG: FAD-dependent oxidoreductase [Balneolaceae bacterium]|nr:FAD-dependent oxidoreductase [Balneolaceae bacterium]
MNNHSYWEEDSFNFRYDLVVVGAGITGLSSALFFKREFPGRSVLVLERGAIPQGASTRNAGFACIGSITEHLADLERTTPQEVRERILRRYRGLELLKQTVGVESLRYTPCGGYELFTSEEEFQRARDHIPTFNRWLQELTGQQEVYRADTLNGYPVISNRLEGALHPGQMMRILVHLAREAGVEIRWNAEVHSVRSSGSVRLDDGTKFTGTRVLVAANGFAGRLLPEIDVVPARGYLFVTRPLKELRWRGTFHYDRGYIYFRDLGDRLLLGGARNVAEAEEKTDAFGVNARIRNHLMEFANDILELETGWAIDREWSGIMGFTDTKTPVVRGVEGRVYVAAGLSGMGVAIGMQVAREAVALLEA